MVVQSRQNASTHCCTSLDGRTIVSNDAYHDAPRQYAAASGRNIVRGPACRLNTMCVEEILADEKSRDSYI